MSLLELNPNSTRKLLDLVELPNKIPLILPKEVVDKIKYLCKNIPQVEWSGPLFYTIEGSIKDPANFKITVKDILPLDMGTAAFTSYQNDNRFIDYMMEEGKEEERLDWSMGHCHSHNVMRVFFSGTDKAELMDNAYNYNFYLSLIVNNYMEMVAWVAFIGTMESHSDLPYEALDEEGNKYTIQTNKFRHFKEKLFYYPCEIITDVEKLTVDEDFQTKVAEIMKPKEVKTHITYPSSANTTTPAYAQKPFPQTVATAKDISKFSKDFIKDFDFQTVYDDEDSDLPADYIRSLDLFATDLVNVIGKELTDEIDLLDILDEIKISQIDELDFCNKVMERYSEVYVRHFPSANSDAFARDAYEICDILYVEEESYPFLNPLITVITRMVKQFEKIEK